MSALDFPDNPAVGDLYGSSSTLWRWNGTTWDSTAGASGQRGRVAYTQRTTSQGGIDVVMVDIAGMSVTWTANPTRTYKTTVHLIPSATASGVEVTSYLRDGGGALKQIGASPYLNANTSTTQTITCVETGLSGSVTRKVQAMKSGGPAGTVTYAGDPQYPMFILVEDITYEAGSAGPSKAPLGWLTTIINSADYANITTEAPTCSGQVDVVAGRKYYATIQQAFAQTVATDTFLVASKIGGVKVGHHLGLQNNAWQVMYGTSMMYTAVATGIVPCQITLARIAGTGTATSGGTTYLNTTMNIFDAGQGP